MTNEIETIREALDILDDFLTTLPNADGTPYKGPKPKRFREALAILETELTALRANAFDLGKIPDRWRFYELSLRHDNIFRCQMELFGAERYIFIEGEGHTPAAALKSAIERIGK